MSELPTTEQWLARGVCSRGHALYGPGDLVLCRDGCTRCGQCESDMTAERAALRNQHRNTC